jgi:ATP-dependent DNA helicase RecG
LRLATTDADEAFLKRVIEEAGRRGSPLPIGSLIALAALRRLKRLTTDELAVHIQREPAQAKRTLEALVEAGLAQAHGATRAGAPTRSLPASIRQRGARPPTSGNSASAVFSMSSWC